MSSITHPARILLTGGTGFVGGEILRHFLSKKLSVRAAVRSDSKAQALGGVFKSYVSSGHLTFAIVPDITTPNAFDEAVKDVGAVVHTASPMLPTDPELDPKELIQPAVQGTVGILDSVSKFGNDVKRVVITSSIVTLIEPREPGHVYSDKDWFDTAPKLVEQHGVNTPGLVKYIASKVLAEQAAWKWVEENKPSFEVVTTLPPWIFGESTSSSLSHFGPGSSNEEILRHLTLVNAGKLEPKDYLTTTPFTDVKDVAEGHYKALLTPGLGGKRLLLFGGNYATWQGVFDLLNAKPIKGVSVPVGQVGNGKNAVPERVFAWQEPAELLGLQYRPLDDTIHEMISQAVELGWKQ